VKALRFSILTASVVFIGAIALLGAQQSIGGVIDSFGGDIQLLQSDAGTLFSQGTTVNAGVLGGERDVTLSQTSAQGGGRLLVNEANISGVLDFSMEVGSTGVATIVWDGVDGNENIDADGLGGFDLTAGGLDNAFSLIVSFDDLPTELSMTVYSGEQNVSKASVLVNSPVGAGAEQEYLLLFSDFAVVSGSGADFTSAGAVVLEIDHFTPATDFQLDMVQTVPEPSTILLLIGGALSAGLLARRRLFK